MAQNIFLGSIVPDPLRGHNNYREWSHCMKTYLVSQGLWDNIITEEISTDSPHNLQASDHDAESTDSQQASDHDSESPVVNQQASDHDEDRRRKNATALHAILITCEPDILRQLNVTDSAQIAWNLLAESYGEYGQLESPQIDDDTENENYHVGFPHEQAYKGEWQWMEKILMHNPGAVSVTSATWGETALHVAVQADNVEMVKKVVDLMTPEDLEITDNSGYTAFHYAASRGIVDIASYMIAKNERLLRIPTNDDFHQLPITTASQFNQRAMTAYLLSKIPSDWLYYGNNFFGSEFLEHSISSHMLDIAWKALNDHPYWVNARFDHSGFNALLWSLSNTPGIFPSSGAVRRLVFWKRWIYSNKLHGLVWKFLKFLAKKNSGINQIYELKRTHACSSSLLDQARLYLSDLDYRQCQREGIDEACKNAVKFGIDEIVTMMVEIQPRLLRTKYEQENNRDLLMLSIVNRHEKTFNLSYGSKESGLCTVLSDGSLNTLLHLAGMLSPAPVLTRIPGAALQMQRELQWYQAVESIVIPDTKFKLNYDNKTPEEVFSKNHMQLVKDGEKWMKGTATSYTVVAALIITVTFAAAFTVPGGNFQDIGIPVFLHKKAFLTFILADAISLFSASTSVLMFLGILTSRFARQDFLKSLPTKLIIGISMLFVSITAMMVAFCAALVVTLRGRLEVIILIVVLACVPVILFFFLQFPLLVEMLRSTYGSGILIKKKIKKRHMDGASYLMWILQSLYSI